ncbi:DUF5908 family protein [Psychroserpens sp.]|uniref:DUF5908 family protein n=1 Tax=Psychroserpens sp. TaxID=2020870 RepID=UPI002B2705BC|nr:DUF5908 family protein [Psychroserpens sp.]
MAIEIREVIIKTEIRTSNSKEQYRRSQGDMDSVKKELLEECKRMLLETTKRKIYKR